MARENQGLQIVLIIFVAISILLGVTTYVGFKNAAEAQQAKAAAEESKLQSDRELAKAEANIEELKRMIGAAKNESIEAVKDMFAKDMNTTDKPYAAGWPEEVRYYHQILAKMQKALDDKNREAATAKEEIPKLTDTHKKWDATQVQQVQQYEAEAKKSKEDLAALETSYEQERTVKNEDLKKAQDDATNSHKEVAAAKEQAAKKVKGMTERLEVIRGVSQAQAEKIEKLTEDKMTTPNGEISWVNQRNATVWIDLGRVDALTRQITFSVWPSSVSDMTATRKKKASIEVTQILGDHLAEARIIDDTPENPIVPGDKIYTPLWNSGVKRHFAIVGMVDLDGDGKSDMQTVMNLITASGGVVDCYVADTGKNKDMPVGSITVNTNCLLMGAKPDENSSPQQLATFTKLLREADELRISKKQLGDFLQQVGWKNVSPVVRYGANANPEDFRAKSDLGYQRKSAGSVSKLYDKRNPPKPVDPANGSTTTPTPSGGGRAGGMYQKF